MATAISPTIFPEPRFAHIESETPIPLRGIVPVWFSPTFSDAKIIRLALGRMLKPVKMKLRKTASNGFGIRIGTPDDGGTFQLLAKKYKKHLPNRKLSNEGYVLSASRDGINIVAVDSAGVFYALQSLKQLLKKRGQGWLLPTLEAADAPVYPFRGIHLSGIMNSNEKEMKTLVQEIMPRYKANTLVLTVNYHLRFKSHPEIKESWSYTYTQARKLVALCREQNIRLIPLVNCLGHQSWRTSRIGALLQAYPEFNETPGAEDPKYCYNWCPCNPKITPIINAVLDEVIDAFEADAIHLGMDEVFDLGVCQRCKGKSTGDLFAKSINDLYRHVTKKRKVQMLIWGDRLIDGKKTPYNEMNGARNGTHTALSKIPKDIFICDWHYHLHDSYPSVARFNRAGFDYVTSSYKKPWATDAFMSYAAQHGGKRYRGHLDTNWGGIKEIIKVLSSGKAGKIGKNDQADCTSRGLELSWSGADDVIAITKAQEEKYKKTRAKETELY